MKVLMTAPNLRVSNGITSFIMGNYDFLCESGVQVDFLLSRLVDSPYNSYVLSKGSKIFVYPCPDQKYSIENGRYAKDVLAQNKYEIIHCNETGMFAVWILFAAYKYKNINCIYHAHNPKETSSLKAIVRQGIFDSICLHYSHTYVACTKHAGKSVFGNRSFKVVNNGIDVQKFIFNEYRRIDLREQLGVTEKYVIGTVCRQAEQKNPFFMVDIFEKCVELQCNMVLVWIGTGPLLGAVREYIAKKGLNEKVIFLGDIQNPCDYYSAMDCFLLPSKYEGLGIAFLEAQIAGLTCFASDKVPLDINISGNVIFTNLNERPENWATLIIKQSESVSCERNLGVNNVELQKIDIKSTRKQLLKIYYAIVRGENQ